MKLYTTSYKYTEASILVSPKLGVCRTYQLSACIVQRQSIYSFIIETIINIYRHFGLTDTNKQCVYVILSL